MQAICYLLDHGKERLLAGIDRGVIPTSVAMETALAKDTEIQENHPARRPPRQRLRSRRVVLTDSTGRFLEGRNPGP